MNHEKTILTITGSDPTGLSGIQADDRTISALGGHALTAITSITVQTTLGIQQFYDVPAEIVAGQIDAAMNDFQPQTVKIGLIRNERVLDAIVDALRRYRPRHVIYTPTAHSSQGDVLMGDEVVARIRERLLPLCTLVVSSQLIRNTPLSHGQANCFSSAVAVFLSEGATQDEALTRARAYVGKLIAHADRLQGRAGSLYNEFLDAVAAHCRKNRDVAFYADRLNVSSRYLAQVTRRICGKSPKAIIDDCLIGEICRQLATTDMTIQEVAYAFSFSSQGQLTKFFQKMKGTTPTLFRRDPPPAPPEGRGV